MDPNSIPSTNSPQPQTFVVPDANTLQSTNFRTPDSPGIKKYLVIGGIVLLVCIGAGVFFIAPKIMTSGYATALKPKIISLKSSTALVKTSINVIHYDITSDSSGSSSDSLRSSGLLIQPKVANLLIGSSVLGVSTKKLGLLERSMLDIQEQVKGRLESLIEKNNVAADSSTDNPYNAKFRMIKDETQKVSTNIAQAQGDFNSLSNNIKDHPLLLSAEAQNKVVKDTILNTEIKPYLDQAQKISTYYQNLADMVINMNTKIVSFKTALASTTTTFSQLKNPNLTMAQTKTILAQSQVYLDQAKKDAADIKNMTQNFKNMSADSLPAAADKYQAHNIQVLEIVGNYFDTESTIMQGFIDGSNNIIKKAQSGTLTSIDTNSYLNKISKGGQDAALADTKFVSDLNTLTGEETSLTISFWQDNGILNKGNQVESDLNRLQQNINSL